MRGRKPKPTNLRVLQGNPGKRPLPENEPKPTPLAPKRPSWLVGEARREWERIAPELEKLGLLTVVDGAALAAYCQAYATMVQAEKELRAHFRKHKKLTVTYVNKFGAENEVPHPAIKIARDAAATMKSFLTEFGLTPASRVRLAMPRQEEPDDYEAFRRRGRASG
jgi:P27 family predicted phage terminase small subunit